MSTPVVLLHGIWMPGAELYLLKRRLEEDGEFSGHLFSYASVGETLDGNAARLAELVRGLDADTVHLVGHSLGGVVALRMLLNERDAPPGRVLCLGSPLTGSRAAGFLERYGWGRRLAGRTLRTGVVDSPASDWAGPVTAAREVGVIAGTLPYGLGRLVVRFDGDSDGTVAVEETRLPGISDHLCLPVSHTTLATSKDVAVQTAAFLRRGEFLRED